ncbi:hypothetical protein WN943_025847 [Citrus x changshan-huyou]
MKRNNLLWFLLELCCIIMLPLLQPSFARSFARPSPLFAPQGRKTLCGKRAIKMRNEMKLNNLLWFLLELFCIIMLLLLQPSFARQVRVHHPPPPPPLGSIADHPWPAPLPPSGPRSRGHPPPPPRDPSGSGPSYP